MDAWRMVEVEGTRVHNGKAAACLGCQRDGREASVAGPKSGKKRGGEVGVGSSGWQVA